MEQLTFWSEEHHVKTSHDSEKVSVLMDSAQFSRQILSLLLTCRKYAGLCWKMSSARLSPTGERILQPFYPCSADMRSEFPKKDGKTVESSQTETLIDLGGGIGCLTLNIPELPDFPTPSRNAGAVSCLSDILETGDLPQRFYFTGKALIGASHRVGIRRHYPKIFSMMLKKAAMEEKHTVSI